MKRAVFTLWLLLAAVAATAQGNSPDFEFEYSDLQLSPDDYIGLQLPPLHQLLENARNTPQVEYYNKAVEIQERELKNVRRNWQHYFKINANYNYGSSDIYNQNYQDNSNQIWTTTTTGREQSWWNVGASFSLPIDEIFNRRNKIKQQKRRRSSWTRNAGSKSSASRSSSNTRWPSSSFRSCGAPSKPWSRRRRSTA
mgnify:CR=1 FL=1